MLFLKNTHTHTRQANIYRYFFYSFFLERKQSEKRKKEVLHVSYQCTAQYHWMGASMHPWTHHRFKCLILVFLFLNFGTQVFF
jgi:hypothetical protein